MRIRKYWNTIRRFVPVQVYPLLAPAFRWNRRHALERLEKNDQDYFSKHPDVLAPPANLRVKTAGECTIPQFLKAGELIAQNIEKSLRIIGISIGEVRNLLDFGCGCGRLLLHAKKRWPHMKLSGCDVDREAIHWCKDNLEDIDFVINDQKPPLLFTEESFELIWCGSVFTHLDENHQNLWLEELYRMLTPDGILLASVHGPYCWESRLPSWTTEKIRKRGFLFAKTGAEKGIHPEWYQVAWHTEEYVRSHWASTFEICEYIPRALNEYQDIVVAKKRS